NPKTGTMRVELDVADPKGLLRPGMNGAATIQIQNNAPGVLHVPRSALTPTASLVDGRILEGMVYVVRGKTAHATRVECGAASGNQVEIVSGLRPTDLIVLQPGASWEETVPVMVKESPGAK